MSATATSGSTVPAAYYASRPTIKIDGREVATLGEDVLISLLVEETRLGLSRCEMHLLNWGPKDGDVTFQFFDRALLDFGKELGVVFGPHSTAAQIFTGVITAIEGHYPAQRAPEVTILAEDRLQDLRMTRRTRTFEDVSDADVFRRVAADHALTPQIDADGPTHRVLVQVNQSDLAFLRERAAAIDAELWIADGTLHVQTRGRRRGGDVELAWGSTLLEFTVLADLAHQRSTVKVSGWDVAAKQAIDVEAGDSAISGELNGGQSGSALLASALDERHERIYGFMPRTTAEARAYAEAAYRERARRFLRGVGIADGNPAIRVGTRLKLSELGALFDGNYDVTVVRHSFDLQHGYRTTFEVERPWIAS